MNRRPLTRQPISAAKRRRVRELRANPTPAEKALWERLRQLSFRFRRQQYIDGFIADFYCATARLVVEVDGGVHEERVEEDARREAVIKEWGIEVLRATNEEVLQDVDGVARTILARCHERMSPAAAAKNVP